VWINYELEKQSIEKSILSTSLLFSIFLP